MAPRQPTIQQARTSVKQLLFLLDCIDMKSLTALRDMENDRIQETKEDRDLYLTHVHNRKLLELIIQLKAGRSGLRQMINKGT